MRIDVANELSRIGGDFCLLNKSELARRFGCDRRTIDKYIGEGKPIRKSRTINSKLDNFKEIIIDKVDSWGSNSMSIFKYIQKQGYDGGYHTVNNFVKSHKKEEVKKASIRFETHPGLQAQVDWKENLKMVNRKGEVYNINIFLMVLGYSRLKYLKLTEDRTQKTLFSCMYEAFEYIGGVPKEILFDKMATVVDRASSNLKSVVLNQKFKRFSLDGGFNILTCRPYRPKTKGKVETLSKLVDRLTPYNGEFENFDELEKIVVGFNEEINKEISQATNELPIERFKKEKEHLSPLPNMDNLRSYFHHEKEYKVSNESMIRYKGKKYSVPTKYIGKHVTVLQIEDFLQIYYNRDLLESHRITEKNFHYKISHAKEILKSDAMKYSTDSDIDNFIEESLKNMDIFLEE